MSAILHTLYVTSAQADTLGNPLREPIDMALTSPARGPGGKSSRCKRPGAESNCRHADFQSAALPTELPGRAMQQKNLAGRLGRWECQCLPLRSAIIHPSNPSSLPMRTAFSIAATALAVTSLVGQEPYRPPVVGRWDLTLTAGDGRKLPSWLEVQVSGNHVLVGRFVAVVGRARSEG